MFKYEVILTVNVSSLFLQVLDRTTEETAGSGEDVDHEGQHNQHLCYGNKCCQHIFMRTLHPSLPQRWVDWYCFLFFFFEVYWQTVLFVVHNVAHTASTPYSLIYLLQIN